MPSLKRISLGLSLVMAPTLSACGGGSTAAGPGASNVGTGGEVGDSGLGGAGADSAGAGGAVGAQGKLQGEPSTVSGIPHAGDPDQPVPKGAVANLRVLNWAGFLGAASYTFDDSQPSQVDYLPDLSATGVRMTFYMNPTSNWYAGYNAAFSLAVASGHELGNHTMSHCRSDLSNCAGQPPLTPVGSAEDEVDQCNDYITQNLGQAEVWSIAYPYGDASWSSIAESRFLLGRGVGAGMVSPLDTQNRFNLPTFSAVGKETAEDFRSSLDQARITEKWVIFLLHSLTPTTYNWYAGVDTAEVVKSIEYGKSSGGVWLDSLINIGSYWLGQELLANATPTESGADLVWSWSLPAHFPSGKYVRVTVEGGTLSQGQKTLPWDAHGYYEVALDARELTWSP